MAKQIKKIVYILKPSVDIYPPCVSQIRIIKDLGYEIEVWFGHCGVATRSLLEASGVSMIQLRFAPDSTTSKVGKLRNWLEYRHAVLKKMKAEDRDHVLFWFGTAESAIPLFPLDRKRRMVMSVLELMDDRKVSRFLSAHIARKCIAVTACEDNRANIMRFWWNLDRKPFVIPNKPYEIQISVNAKPSCGEVEEALRLIGDRPFVIYQGIFQNVEYISKIAYALSQGTDMPLLVMMGSDRRNIVPQIKKIYKNTIYIQHIQSPNHLEITSHALLGVVCYDHSSLNKLYCAPNKIFEYSKFGIPMLANDVPGLIHTVGAYKAGVCVDFDSQEEVAVGIEKLLVGHDEYSSNAINFYNSIDNRETVRRLLEKATQ